MKRKIRKYIPIFSLLIILALLFTQVQWIIYSINFQETVFKKSVKLALNETITNLTANKPLCSKMKECVARDTVTLKTQLTSTGVWEQIHDAIDEELHSYEICLDYDLYILENNSKELKNILENDKEGIGYTRCLGSIMGKAGYQLVVTFPNRTGYFLQTAGLMFLSSILLIFLLIMSIVYLLRIYKRELRIAEHTKELLNNVSHEFKTPLSSIALASNMIRKKRFANEKKLENYAELIAKENKKLQHLVESLLHLAAIERDDFEYLKENLELNNILLEGISTFDVIIQELNGTIKYNQEIEGLTFFADRLHFTNVLVNLISNAIKYSKESPFITIQAQTINKNIHISVTDKGIGIPVKYQRYIFDKYYRVPTGDVHNVKGFGIGLAYVKQVVEAHGGTISVESSVGKGTTFIMIFPQ